MSTQPLGNLVRIAPLDLSELPPHPDIPKPAGSPPPTTDDSRLLTFILTILEEASTFLSPSNFTSTFTRLSTKSSPPSISSVDVFKREIPASEISTIPWSETQPVPRKAPSKIENENWFARKSLHYNKSSQEEEGSASWPEFVFGLKQQHSKHEQDFTPTLYDARYILDWNEETKRLKKFGDVGEGWIEGKGGVKYADVTMESEFHHPLPHSKCSRGAWIPCRSFY
jgi:Protein of unknown function (DUF3074)